nr:uncharacterized protein LOC127338246 [Lolium perenne]
MEPAGSIVSRSSAASRREASSGGSSGARDLGRAIVLADGKAPCDELGDAQPVLLCACSRPALSLRANTIANPYRYFLKCGNPARPPVRCESYRGIQGCFLWIWEDLLKSYTDAKVAYATRRLEAENAVLVSRGRRRMMQMLRICRRITRKRSTGFKQSSLKRKQTPAS